MWLTVACLAILSQAGEDVFMSWWSFGSFPAERLNKGCREGLCQRLIYISLCQHLLYIFFSVHFHTTLQNYDREVSVSINPTSLSVNYYKKHLKTTTVEVYVSIKPATISVSV